MKTTVNGFRINKNGVILKTIEKEAISEDIYLGKLIKENGKYYMIDRKQGNKFIYLPL